MCGVGGEGGGGVEHSWYGVGTKLLQGRGVFVCVCVCGGGKGGGGGGGLNTRGTGSVPSYYRGGVCLCVSVMGGGRGEGVEHSWHQTNINLLQRGEGACCSFIPFGSGNTKYKFVSIHA